MKQKNLYFYTNLLAWGLVLFLIGNYVFGWTTPTATPPSSNLPAPINVGSTNQSKQGYLAVGTSTTPSFPLDVAGTIQSTGFKLPTGAATDKILTSDASGIASWQVPAGGSLWSQSGDDIYYNTGNVAIGTSTPGTAKLKILGGVLDMTSQKITNLATPTADTDAATKAYVDSKSLTCIIITCGPTYGVINATCTCSAGYIMTGCKETYGSSVTSQCAEPPSTGGINTLITVTWTNTTCTFKGYNCYAAGAARCCK